MGRTRRLHRRVPERTITAVLVALAVGFTLAQLHPGLLVSDTVASGGDMGAHVWGPAFLRDHLLPQWRLSGWSPDWYAGFPAYHFYMVLPSLAIVALDVVLPYNVAFKLVTVSGILSLPVAAWAFGHLGRLPFPGPALLAVATVPFLFERSFTIYGGNIASTLAGEFSFSISLSLALLYFGVLARGLETGRHRALAAALFGVAVLCHVIPALFAAAGTVLLLAVHWGRSRAWYVATVGAVGGALTAFWAVPFLWRRGYMTDMGWEKVTTYSEVLFPGRLGTALTRALGNEATATITGDMTWVILLAAVGTVTSFLFRRRLGIFLVLLAIMFAGAFLFAPQARLWNARLLPFWYLCLYLLAAVAVSELATSLAALVARRPDRPVRAVVLGVPVAATLAVLVVVGLPLRSLPFGSTSADGTYRWAGLSTTDRSFIPDWAEWNYSGYQAKAAYPEFRALLATMADVGEERGCGRAMWEYESELDRFGTPMALMLLPYATDGCIDSMEGLYFEASATTPYHFLNASELSAKPSNPQRGLPYATLNVADGVKHLQMMGVRYYMAFSAEAVAQAAAEPDLSPIAASGAWQVYEVADSALVQPLDAEPVTFSDVPAQGPGWEEAAVDWYMDFSAHGVLRAASGPPAWARVARDERPPRRPVADVTVGDIETTTDTISFTVDEPGAPVLVKTSYFPNWQVEGAEGPYRVAPNLMVVVPTDTSVELRYGSTPVEWLAWALTVLGILGLVVLLRSGRLVMPPLGEGKSDDESGSRPDPMDEPPSEERELPQQVPLVLSGPGPTDGGSEPAPQHDFAGQGDGDTGGKPSQSLPYHRP